MCFEAAGRPLLDPGTHVRRQRRLEGIGDSQCHVALDGEDVGQVAVIVVCPEVLVGLRIDELSGDADAAGRASHATLDDVGDPQLSRDLPEVLVGVLVLHDRGAGDDFQVGDLAQVSDDVLGHAVAEVLVVGIGTQVGERQHRDGQPVGASEFSRGPDRLDSR